MNQTAQSSPDISQLLKSVAVFSVLTDAERNNLAGQVRMAAYRPGEFIVREGKSGTSIYVIESGVCEVFAKDEKGYDKKVAQIDAGDFFGEMSLLTGEPHSATVRALEDTNLVAINKLKFASILEANPSLSKELGKVLAKRQQQLAAMVGRKAGSTASSSNMVSRIKSFFKLD